MLAVVTERARGSTRLWFEKDLRSTLYRGALEGWSDFYIPPGEYRVEGEERHQKLEAKCGVRLPRNKGSKGKRSVGSDRSGSESNDEGEGERVREIETWESDAEGDGGEQEPFLFLNPRHHCCLNLGYPILSEPRQPHFVKSVTPMLCKSKSPQPASKTIFLNTGCLEKRLLW